MRINCAPIVFMKRGPFGPALLTFKLRLFLSIVIASGCLTCAQAYVLEGSSWPREKTVTSVTFQMGLGPAGRTLIDGNTSWDVAAAPAINAWDNVVATLQFNANLGASSAAASGDG